MPDDEHLADRIRELIADEPGVTEKRMFRGLAFLIEGNMSVAASGRGGLLLQVDPAQTAALISRSNAEGTLMRGREMDSGLPSGGRSGAAQTPTGAPGGLRPTASTKAYRSARRTHPQSWDVAEITAMYNLTNRMAMATNVLPNQQYSPQARAG